MNATSIRACRALMQVALIVVSGTPTVPWLVQIWSVVVVVVVVACYCCILLQLALMLLPDGVVFLPSTGTNTPFAHVVVSICCNLYWWCFSIHQLVQILHLHTWWSSPAATCVGGVCPSSHWRTYSTCTHATCTVWWWLNVVVLVVYLWQWWLYIAIYVKVAGS